MSRDEFGENPFFAGINEIRGSWGWFLFFGIALIFCGVACILANVAATWAAVVVFGWMMLAAGIFALVQAFKVHTWSGFFLYLLSAIFRGFAGYLLVRYPKMGAEALTLIVAAFFVVAGLFRATGATMLKFPYWGWSTFSGIVSFVLGVILLTQLPVASIWFIGLAIGIDMIFDGTALIAFSSAIHTLPKFTEYKTKHA